MNSIIFAHGLNYVTYTTGELIPNNLPLYYWHNSANQYKPVGTLRDIKTMSTFGDNYVNGNLDGVITRLGNVRNVVLYYNSTPDLPIVHIAPDVAPSPEPIPVTQEQAQDQAQSQYQAQSQASITYPKNDIPEGTTESVNR